jgi:hypothetical protein
MSAAVLVEVNGNVHAFFVEGQSFVQIAVTDGPLEEDWLQRALAQPVTGGEVA